MNSVVKLNSLIREQYNLLDELKTVAIFPDELADLVYAEIDPEEVSPELVKFACLLELRQLARAICRGRSSNDPIEDQQLWLFPLQCRYPALRDGKPGYVLRGKLTYEERCENSARLKTEGVAKVTHARALDAETNALVRSGELDGPIIPLN